MRVRLLDLLLLALACGLMNAALVEGAGLEWKPWWWGFIFWYGSGALVAWLREAWRR